MSEKIIHRIAQIISHYRLSLNGFDAKMGLGNNYIGSMIRREGNVGSDVIQKIVSVYPEINLHWLVSGDGEMFETADKKQYLVGEAAAEYDTQGDLFELTLLKYLDRSSVQDKIKSIVRDEGREEKATD